MAVDKKVFISKEDEYYFGEGTHYEIYKKLGAHPSEENGRKGMFFAVWAPNAKYVHVIGTFNNWDEMANPMIRCENSGIYTTFVEGVGTGELYKFLIETPDGEKLYKADPFANHAELRPGNASRTTDLRGFRWGDAKWFENRKSVELDKQPIAIYECHIGIMDEHPDGQRWFLYI